MYKITITTFTCCDDIDFTIDVYIECTASIDLLSPQLAGLGGKFLVSRSSDFPSDEIIRHTSLSSGYTESSSKII